jgi:hypothetical protein
MKVILSNQIISLKLCKLLLLQHGWIKFLQTIAKTKTYGKRKKMWLYFTLAHGMYTQAPTMLRLSDQSTHQHTIQKNLFWDFLDRMKPNPAIGRGEFLTTQLLQTHDGNRGLLPWPRAFAWSKGLLVLSGVFYFGFFLKNLWFYLIVLFLFC